MFQPPYDEAKGTSWIAFVKLPDGKYLCYGVQNTATNASTSAPCPIGPPLNFDESKLPKIDLALLQAAAERASVSSAIASASKNPPVPVPSTPISNTDPGAKSATSVPVGPVSHGLSNGAVAGIAIGVFLIGVLSAGIVFFVLLRRQKKRQVQLLRHDRSSRHMSGTSREKGLAVMADALTSSVDEFIPQPVADDIIRSEISKIRDNIKNHVRTYYHSAKISSSSIEASGLQNLAMVTGVSATTLADALENPATRQDVLRLVLSWTILPKCTGERDPSLLSLELFRLASSIQAVDGNDNNASRLYSKWKAITGALLLQRFGKNAHDSSRAETFTSTVAELDLVLAPFVQGSVDGGQRRKNLDMILTRAANFAFLLFSQPGSFRFDFASGHGGLVAFPALVQIVGDQGQVLRPARVLMDKEVAV